MSATPTGRLVLFRGDLAVVRAWEPASHNPTDTLLYFLDPSEVSYAGGLCWVGMSDCRPVDGMGPLPDRMTAVRLILDEQRRCHSAIYRDHIRNHLNGERWPYLEFGRGMFGQMLERTLAELGVDSREIVREVFAERDRKATSKE